MKKILLIPFVWFLVSCQHTRYIEKTSEPLSQTVWATKDSIDYGRFDLADKYINQAIKLIPAPEKRIEIKPIMVNTKD